MKGRIRSAFIARASGPCRMTLAGKDPKGWRTGAERGEEGSFSPQAPARTNVPPRWACRPSGAGQVKGHAVHFQMGESQRQGSSGLLIALKHSCEPSCRRCAIRKSLRSNGNPTLAPLPVYSKVNPTLFSGAYCCAPLSNPRAAKGDAGSLPLPQPRHSQLSRG